MATRKPVVYVGGKLRQLPAGDDVLGIHAAGNKATPADADELPIADSADSWSLKKLTLANLLAWIKSKPLTGLSLADTSAVTATDTVLQGMGKLQAGKSAIGHTHVIANVTGLAAALDNLLDVPTSTITSAAYTLQLADRGKCVDVGHDITVPKLATVAFPKGSVVNLQNNSATSRTITAESGATVYLAGDSTKTGPFTLKGYGWVVLRKIDTASTWVISGAGI